jgi:hypothetical protein
MAVEHRHHEPECLVGAEHQRREPEAPPDPVPAVGSADGFDRDTGLPEDADVATGGAIGDAELLGEAFGGDAGAGLQQLQGQERPGRGARVERHQNPSRMRKQNVRN